ncbi:MAG: alkaline phosphatase D family protein [Nocardioides sp.]|nr:alkaline phosphatase D family protein [Nocardioides sp.]
MTTLLPTRRSVLASAAGVAATGAAGARLGAAQAAGKPRQRPQGARFVHGVASGDPLPTQVVIWTRVTPIATATPGSGVGPTVVGRWEVAKDKRFTKIVRGGPFTTSAGRDHTIKVDVTGLDPATWYFYRFSVPKHRSPVGRTRTAPALDATPENLRFGVVSCANLRAGFFSAYRALAARDDLDAIVHLGDYLYEYGPGEYGLGPDDIDVRPHVPAHEMISLGDYRQRHAQYKQDPDLQAAHLRYPWIITWDDHEVTNDAWAGGAESHTQGAEGDYLARRTWAHRAYDEWMPVRMSSTAKVGDGTRLYRRFQFGQLAELSMLDLRTYRSEQVKTALPAPAPASEAALSDPARTLTGDAQMAWLKSSLDREVQWKIVGNPVMIAPVAFGSLPQDLIKPINDVTGLLPTDGFPYNVDQWDGYTADRREVLDVIRDKGVKDALFITGDIHSGWAAELPYDAATYPLGDSAGVEFVCTSVTSNNLKDILAVPRRTGSVAVEQAITANNRHIKYLNFDDHGFSVLDLTSRRAQMDWYIIGDRADRDTAVTWTASYKTDATTGRVQAVGAPVQES